MRPAAARTSPAARALERTCSTPRPARGSAAAGRGGRSSPTRDWWSSTVEPTRPPKSIRTCWPPGAPECAQAIAGRTAPFASARAEVAPCAGAARPPCCSRLCIFSRRCPIDLRVGCSAYALASDV
eukprot:scaffold20728_cov132-Isochrysis_galbana.AAC.8